MGDIEDLRSAIFVKSKKKLMSKQEYIPVRKRKYIIKLSRPSLLFINMIAHLFGTRSTRER
jgi:hypothetical protein